MKGNQRLHFDAKAFLSSSEFCLIFRGVVVSLKRLDGWFRAHGEYKLRAFLRSRDRSACAAIRWKPLNWPALK